MSRNEWERGEFKLPSAEYADFRQTIQRHDKAVKERAFALTQECWKSLSRKEQTDPNAYVEAAGRFCHFKGHPDEPYRPLRIGGRVVLSVPDDPAISKAHLLMGLWNQNRKPKRVLKSDVDWPTNRTTYFSDRSCSVTFDPKNKTVHWETDDGNHAVDGARESALGKAFFARLDKVRWTHGTGGSLVGNDEYNQDNDDVGGGANYCTGAYGYLGIQQNPERVEPFVNARGQHVDVDLTWGRYGYVGKAVASDGTQGRQSAGQPTGGQFAAKTRFTNTGVRLFPPR